MSVPNDAPSLDIQRLGAFFVVSCALFAPFVLLGGCLGVVGIAAATVAGTITLLALGTALFGEGQKQMASAAVSRYLVRGLAWGTGSFLLTLVLGVIGFYVLMMD